MVMLMGLTYECIGAGSRFAYTTKAKKSPKRVYPIRLDAFTNVFSIIEVGFASTYGKRIYNRFR
jgi:hypothetical protein